MKQRSQYRNRHGRKVERSSSPAPRIDLLRSDLAPAVHLLHSGQPRAAARELRAIVARDLRDGAVLLLLGLAVAAQPQ